MQVGAKFGMQTMDSALADPPVSTEQILHPEKYLAQKRDEPLPVTLTPLTATLGTGWKKTDSDTLGEFDLTEMLQNNNVDKLPATEGWGGARYDVYENNAAALVYVSTRWDTVKDATEFADALTTSFSPLKKDGTMLTDGKRYFATKKGSQTLVIVSSNDRAAVQKAIAAVTVTP